MAASDVGGKRNMLLRKLAGDVFAGRWGLERRSEERPGTCHEMSRYKIGSAFRRGDWSGSGQPWVRVISH